MSPYAFCYAPWFNFDDDVKSLAILSGGEGEIEPGNVLEEVMKECGIDPFPEPTPQQIKNFETKQPLVITAPGMSYGR